MGKSLLKFIATPSLYKLWVLLAFVMMTSSVSAKSGKGVFTYFASADDEVSDETSLGLGSSTKVGEVYDVAIYVPAKLAGKKIENISFLLLKSDVLNNVKVWASTKLPTSASAADIFCQDATKMQAYTSGRSYGDISGDYVVPKGGCYVGYSFAIKTKISNAAKYPIAIDEGPGKEGSLFLKTSSVMKSWQNLSVTYDCNSTIAVTLSGNDFFDNAVQFDNTHFKELTTMQDVDKVKLTSSLFGNALNPVNSVSYVVKDLTTGKTYPEETISFETALHLFEWEDVEFDIPNEDKGAHLYQLTLTKVNGVANESAENIVCTGSVLSLEKTEKRKVLEEEFTGTWCGWCPTGIVGMEKCQAQYPDSWIGIAIHGDDELYSTDFDDLLAYVTSFPSANLDRSGDVYPYSANEEIENFLNNPSEASVNVKATWNEDQTKINVSSDVTFNVDREEAPYGVAYVLVGDDIDGGSNCYQSNYLSGEELEEGEEDLEPWVSMDSKVKMNFNHVGIAAKDIANGVDGSIVAPIKAGVTQHHSTEFDLTNGIKSYYGVNLIQDKSKLKVVAILINRDNGRVVNAEETTIDDYSTGINGVATTQDNSVVGIYTIDGKKLNAMVKGVNILKMSNGKVIKVMK